MQFSLLLHSPSSSTTQSTSPFSAEFRWLWQQGGRKFGEIKQGDKRTPCTHKSVHRVVYCCVPVVRLDFFSVWEATLFICIPYRYSDQLGFRFYPLSFIASIFSRRGSLLLRRPMPFPKRFLSDTAPRRRCCVAIKSLFVGMGASYTRLSV